MPLDQLLLFIAAGLLLNLTPGPDVLYIVGQALRSGVRAGMVAAVGITAGCFVHIFAAAVGVSALMAASATAFSLLKWAGAAYLVFLGWRMLAPGAAGWAKGGWQAVDAQAPALPYRLVFLRGFFTNALNPKVALFFLAFVPQFIAPDIENKPLAFFLLGLLFNVNALWVNCTWAAVAAQVAGRSVRVQHSLRWIDRLAGALFVGFGIKLALSAAPQA
jgi:threonine/homoserine/homoserine lactone efflux protein